ncbi:MAG: 3-oxoacyl-ACP synthase III [Candidatus Xenobia bacterium]
MLFEDVCLEGLAYELPPNVISSASIFEELSPVLQRLQMPADRLQDMTGVEERRYWDRGFPLFSGAARAARRALEACGTAASQIGCLISTSVCKDYIEPAMASLVHGELELPPGCLSFDVGNACLAFLNGLAIAADMIEKGRIEAALVVDAENSREVTEATVQRLLAPGMTASRFSEQFAALTLGSGAVAAVLTHRSVSRSMHRLKGLVSLADTRFSKICLGTPTEMITDLKTLLHAGLDLASRTWDVACSTFGWTARNVDLFVCHQVGSTHHKAIFERLGLDPERSYVTYPFLGNMGPASVPITLALARDRGRVKTGDRLALMGIGSGLNCAMMELVW